MSSLAEAVNSLAHETGFSGAVSVDQAGETQFAQAYGLADRAHEIPNTLSTQFGIASGTKGLTALTVVSLISDGALALGTTARSVLGTDLPLIADDVTVGHLLAHRSGIGDYFDEEDEEEEGDTNDYVLTVPAHELATTEQYLAVLGGYPTKFPAGERFSYCNGGYVVLALIAERVSGVPFHDLVRQRVCIPAGMTSTEFLRSDELPGRAALGYLAPGGEKRTNVFHLPVRGSGDGGIYTTVADVSSLWRALFAGQILPSRWVGEMVREHSDVPSESMRYGLGFWLATSGGTVMLIGGDPGVSFFSAHDPRTSLTHTVISNASGGAWPIARRLDELLAAP
jgi:CubicO group peptidase (beta-lactamase class C family)